MQFYPIYQQEDRKKVDEFVRSQTSCRLVTRSDDNKLHLGIFNHVFDGEAFYLHLNRNDEQVSDLKAHPHALLSVEEFLAVIPSYWVDDRYAGASTSYYRYAEFECRVEIVDSPTEVLEALQKLMNHFQPEGRYQSLDPNSEIYRRSFASLVILKLIPVAVRSKWKLGQNRPIATRKQVIDHLKHREMPGDKRAAEEMEAWIASEEK